MVKYGTNNTEGGKTMLKKVFGALAAIALVFGTISQTGMMQNLKNIGSCVCFEHDGAGWSN